MDRISTEVDLRGRSAFRLPVADRAVVRVDLNSFDAEIRTGIERAASELGWELSPVDSDGNEKVDGWLLNASRIELGISNRAMVVIDGSRSVRDHGKVPSWIPSVGFNRSLIGQMAARHLLSLNHPHLAYFSSVSDKWSNTIGNSFFKTCMEADVKPRMIPAPCGSPAERARQLLLRVGSLPHPCAVLADHDRHAVEIIMAARHLGLRIPEDLAVLGIGNLESIHHRAEIPVSSVDPGLEHLGYTAACLLSRVMAGVRLKSKCCVVAPRKVVERQSTIRAMRVPPSIAQAVQIVHSQYCTQLCVPAIARKCGMSVRNLYRGYRDSTGSTIGQDILRLRMQDVADRLLNTTAKLETIAEATGLGNASNLCRMFRKYYGQTPGEWRMGQESRLSQTPVKPVPSVKRANGSQSFPEPSPT